MVRFSAADIAYQKAHITDDRSNGIVISHTRYIALAIAAFMLRLISRRMRRVNIERDDYMIVAAFLFASEEVIGGFLDGCSSCINDILG